MLYNMPRAINNSQRFIKLICKIRRSEIGDVLEYGLVENFAVEQIYKNEF